MKLLYFTRIIFVVTLEPQKLKVLCACEVNKYGNRYINK
jgi:hypothetical protein